MKPIPPEAFRPFPWRLARFIEAETAGLRDERAVRRMAAGWLIVAADMLVRFGDREHVVRWLEHLTMCVRLEAALPLWTEEESPP